MRVGKKERAILLYSLDENGRVTTDKLYHKFWFTFGYKIIPISISPSQISQSLTSLDKKGLLSYSSKQGFIGVATITDKGRELATKYREEIKEYIREWSQFVGGI